MSTIYVDCTCCGAECPPLFSAMTLGLVGRRLNDSVNNDGVTRLLPTKTLCSNATSLAAPVNTGALAGKTPP